MIRGLVRGLLAGLVWLTTLFVIDSIDSYVLLTRSAARIKTDAATRQFLQDAVLSYVNGIALGYLLLSVLGGITLALAMRLASPTPLPRRRWWLTALGLATITTVVGYTRQAVHFPALQDWFFGTRWLADHLDPWMIDIVAGLIAAALLAWSWRRWRGHKGWGSRVLVLAAWLLGVSSLLQNPPPSHAHDNGGPNVILIGIDALRPDHLGFYGYDRDTAPHIDAFLRESAVFDSAWSPIGRTYPSWTSILSGDLPITHGIRDNLPAPDAIVPDVPLLPQQLAARGYVTAFATDDSRFSYMVPGTGFQHIFQPPVGPSNFAVSVNEPRYRAFHGLLHNPIGFALSPTSAYNQSFGKSYRPQLFIDRAQDLLAQVSQADHFLFALHHCVLHAPGDRGWPWDQMYGMADYAGTNRFHYSRSGTTLLGEDPETGQPVNKSAAQDQAIYDSGIDMADRLVGQLVAELKRSGLWDNSIVVLLSDHGEELWAPDLPYKYTGPNHGFHAFGDAQYRVLLGIHFPGGAHAGERITDTARLIDLTPTIADVLQLDWPADVDGASLMPLIEGQHDDPPRPVYSESGLSEARYWVEGHKRYPFTKVSQRYRVDPETQRVHIRPEFRDSLIAAKDRMLQVGRWKLVWLPMKHGAKVRLFDRQADPYNRHDVSAAFPRQTARLGLQLEPYLRRDGVNSPFFDQWDQTLFGPASTPPATQDEAATLPEPTPHG